MKLSTLFFLSIATLVISGCTEKNKVHDFDLVCGYFSELKTVPNLVELNYEQRNAFIMERIEANLSEHTSARVAWEAISHAVSSERYGLFKYAADSIQEGDWQCEPMKELAASTGWF